MNKTTESENNVIRFKEILLALHRGAEPASVFDQFHEVITSASEEEYEQIKKEMIVEGVPGKRAKKWYKNIARNRHSALPSN
ncbi:MAG: DUF438 domain-containing protein [Deltaproteobacteria bacterium]|nr:DUF438 domain-containing protein [Deltaproteobacteria bacterium]